MEPRGLTPETVGADDLERILKGPIFRQLQVAMPPDRAREKVKEILASLPRPPAPEAGEATDAAVGSIKNPGKGSILRAMTSDDDWDLMLDTNLGGAFRCCRAVLRAMVPRS